MPIGENIQYYRKKLDLSQEELGQKLMVSRQTVSLWEKGQTFPTIDNLLRLKEIFGVSVDTILDGEKDPDENSLIPHEKYSFIFTEKELSEVRRFNIKRLIKHISIGALMFLILICFYVCAGSEMLFEKGFTLGFFFLYFIICLKSIRISSGVWKRTESKMLQSCYEYAVCSSDSFTVTISRNGETVRISKINFFDIEKIQDTGKFLLLTVGSQIFILRKSELAGNSAFFFFMNSDPGRKVLQTAPNKWRTLSKILFISTLFSIFAALLCVNVVSYANGLYIENMWIMFLFVPIPLASIILGSALKRKGYKYKKNIVAGFIIMLLLCIYGSFTFIFTGV